MNLKVSSVNSNAALFRVAGVSAILLFVSYLIIIAVYVIMGAAPGDIEALLEYHADHTAEWWLILYLSVLTDFLFIPIVCALYVEFKDVSRNAILAGAFFVATFVVLDLVLTWPAYSSLIDLSRKYVATTDNVERTAILAAATYLSSVTTSSLLGVYVILTPGIGFLIIGLVMINSTFNKITAYLAIGSGVLGIVSVVGGFFSSDFGVMAVILSSTLITFWVFLVGWRLLQLSTSYNTVVEAKSVNSN